MTVLKRRIAAGEAFDIVIPGPELIDELVAQGKVAAGTRAAFGKAGVGLGVRKGAPEALKRLGIEAEMRHKIKTYDLEDRAIALQNGEIDIAASAMGPMMEMPGAELLGGLPAVLPVFKAKGLERD